MTGQIDFEEPHRRYNPLADEWVLVSPGRLSRPWQGADLGEDHVDDSRYDPGCYLCPRNSRAGGQVNPPYSTTYAFDNDFPALDPSSRNTVWRDGLLRAEQHPGKCRVICYSPRHDLSLAELSPASLQDVIDLWISESATLGEVFPWVQIIENRGPRSGASNMHPHGQVWAYGALPDYATREDRSQRLHHAERGSTLLGDYASVEARGPRVIASNPEWLLLVPFWAIWPYETLLVPRHPTPRLIGLDQPQRTELATILKSLLMGYDRLFGAPMPYSMGWHQAPFGEADHTHWQLHAHFMPPLVRSNVPKFMVGYELLSEPQRDLTPEDAAAQLRGVLDGAISNDREG